MAGTAAVFARGLNAKLNAFDIPAVGGLKGSAAPMAAVLGRMPPAALCGNKLMFLRDPIVVCAAMPFAGGKPVAETRTYVDLWRFEADFACAEKFFTHVSLFGLVLEAS